MTIKLANYIADYLVKQGVTDCFTVTGGGAMHLNDAFGHQQGLRCTYNHHEQGSAIAAEGYARATGKLPLVCVTSGPGGTNAITGVMGAYLDSIPMLVVSGQVKRETTLWATDLPLRQLGDQEYPIVPVAEKMTKYAAMVTDPNKIAYHLEKALFLAQNGRPGPVWLDIPLDVQAAPIETESLEHYDPRYDSETQNPRYDEGLTEQILQRLAAARRPVIFAGEGIRMAGAQNAFLALAEKLGIPVVTAWNAHDLIPDEHPCYCGRPGSVGLRGGNFVVQNSDLMLVLGCRLNIRQISYNWEQFAPDAFKIMVDIDAAELFKPTLSIDLPIHANVRDVIASFSAALSGGGQPIPPAAHSSWLAHARRLHEKYPAALPEYFQAESPLNPYAFMDIFSRQWREGETVVCGNGSACVVTFQAVQVKKGQRIFTNSGCAAMGYGLPAALGAAVGTGGRIVCIDGDGSLMMNIQELQTISQNRLDVKIFLLNNNGYCSIRQTQTNLFDAQYVGIGPESGDLCFPDFQKVAEAFSLAYVRLETLSHTKDVVNSVLDFQGPVLCEVLLDPCQPFEPKLSSKRLPDGTMVSPPIDDMFPFLPRQEYEANKATSWD